MAKLRKHKLSWKPSDSNHVVGYRLYWSNTAPVDYSANYCQLGNVTEIDLSEVLLNAASSEEPIYVGISAVDADGNESDIVSLSEPCHLKAPAAPMGLTLTAIDASKDLEPKKAENHIAPDPTPNSQPSDRQIRQEFLRPNKKFITTEGRITEDFGKFLSESLKD